MGDIFGFALVATDRFYVFTLQKIGEGGGENTH